MKPGAWPVGSSRGLCAALVLGIGCLSGACQRGIGDACDTALRCSTSGTRVCDLTQPKGYCTLPGCDTGTCPSESVCVRFWPRVERPEDADRLGTNYCMRKCDERSDCRDDEGYDCLSSAGFGAGQESRVLGDTKQRFCAVRTERVNVDAGQPDAGHADAGTDGAAESTGS